MARKARALPGTKAPPAPKATKPSKATFTRPYVVFADLHVRADTLSRALVVLQRVGDVAREHNAGIVCLGDFWDLRSSIGVRELHAVIDALKRWEGIPTVFIPGNHDQVSLDGSIHAAVAFSGFPWATVATEPVIDPTHRVAFLPWREEGQDELFHALEGRDWTIFTHAELEGATTNFAHMSPGKVSIATIEAKARACYVGHYHARQKLGSCSWYIGSPFEMNFGERDMPHGIALVTPDKEEPTFIDFDDFPKHKVVSLGTEVAVRAGDFVEVQWPDGADRELVSAQVKALEAQGAVVRDKPLPREDQEPLALATTLEQAIEEYAVAADDPKAALTLGREILAEVSKNRAARHARAVRFERLKVIDFCRVRGTVELELAAQGRVLLKGRQGAGKTSLFDALTWALYGTTTPRKAGQDGARLKGDEVVNDYAATALVEVSLSVDGHPVVIRREKKRGKGSTVRITGEHPSVEKDGIADGDELIARLIGLDYGLWRVCVSLGQGAVGNFVTAADKARKELLAVPFGLDLCPPAQDHARALLKRIVRELEAHRIEIASNEKLLEALRSTDFTDQIATWEHERQQRVAAANVALTTTNGTIAEIDGQLQGEAQWVTLKAQHTEYVAKCHAEISKLQNAAHLVELQRELGGLRAEKGIAERDAAKLSAELASAIERASQGVVPCPVCGKPFDSFTSEQHLQELEQRAVGAKVAVSSFDSRIAQVEQQILEARAGQETHRQGLQHAIDESTATLGKIDQALTAFAVLRANREAAVNANIAAAHDFKTWSEMRNPFEAKQAEIEEQLKLFAERLEAAQQGLKAGEGREALVDFWVTGFGPKGLPAIVFRAIAYDLETRVNYWLHQLSYGWLRCAVTVPEDTVDLVFYKCDEQGTWQERRYEQLSGGERRCCELAFSPFALGDLVFSRLGVNISLVLIDELTTHIGPEEKLAAAYMLQLLERETILVVDHDAAVQGSFDHVLAVDRTSTGEMVLSRER